MALDSDLIISGLALAVSLISALFAYNQQKTGERNLSMTAFLESLDQLGNQEAREARGYVIKNFPDYSKNESQPETQNDSLGNKTQALQIAKNPSELQDRSKIKPKDVLIKNAIGKDEKIFWSVAVGFDRVGFMLFEIGLPKDIRKKFLEWMGETICNVWNRLAPSILPTAEMKPQITRHIFKVLPRKLTNAIISK